jgi:hypothetical protein
MANPVRTPVWNVGESKESFEAALPIANAGFQLPLPAPREIVLAGAANQGKLLNQQVR